MLLIPVSTEVMSEIGANASAKFLSRFDSGKINGHASASSSPSSPSMFNGKMDENNGHC